MVRMLKAAGDRMLMMMAPRTEAAADPTYVQCYCNDSYGLMQRVCGPGGCSGWSRIGGCLTPTGMYSC